jgi:riboflavin transporter FmnP
MVAFSIVPFNLVSRAVTSFITFLVYKKLSVPIKKLIQ